jgi:hypothetical protein
MARLPVQLELYHTFATGVVNGQWLCDPSVHEDVQQDGPLCRPHPVRSTAIAMPDDLSQMRNRACLMSWRAIRPGLKEADHA